MLNIMYENVEYVKGIKENFYFLGVQEGAGLCEDIQLFNGEKTQCTVSKQTLDQLLKRYD